MDEKCSVVRKVMDKMRVWQGVNCEVKVRG